MLKPVLGSPSTIQDSTYQQNREKNESYEEILKQRDALRLEVIRLNNKLLQRQEEMISSYRNSSILKVAI